MSADKTGPHQSMGARKPFERENRLYFCTPIQKKMADLSIEELQNVSHELSRSTPGSRRIAASPGFGGAVGDENLSPVQKSAPKVAKGKQLAAAHKPNVTQPREARSQARINELEETMDELEGKLRAEASAKHELSIQIRKLKASLVEQEQKVGFNFESRRE